MMSLSNEGVVVHGIKDVRLETLDLESVGENDILVAMEKIGVCGTDLHIYLDGTLQGMGREHIQPWVIGHEGGGRVVQVGPKVDNFKVGDRVVLDPNEFCHVCARCREGVENVCCNSKRFRWSHRGLFEKLHVHPASCAYKLDDSVTWAEASFTEPLSCAVHANKRGGVKAGDKVLICGAGPLGLLHLLVAKAIGAQTIIITDIDQSRLDAAKKAGATQTILVERESSPEALGRQINVSTGGGVDVVLEVSGAEFSVQLGIHAIRPAGKMVLVGLSGTGMSSILVNQLIFKQIDIVTSTCFTIACFRESVQLLANHTVDVNQLVSHTFSYKEVGKAFETLADRSKPALKILVDFSQ